MADLPRAILFDLDDTILSAYSQPELAWRAITGTFEALLAPLSPEAAAREILAYADVYWADEHRARERRLELFRARREVVEGAFRRIADAGGPRLGADAAHTIADRFSAYREEQMYVFPGAPETIDELKARGVRLALVTNGAAATQRAKIERFDLARRFDHIQIDGEVGFGKPEERAYWHALDALDVAPKETWMVGDNLEWEVAAPQRIGIFAIWHDHLGAGLPAEPPAHPDRIIRALPELLEGLD